MEAKGGEHGRTCLMIAATNGRLAICRLLLDKGAQAEAKDDEGRALLHFAAHRGHLKIVRLLCDRGADVEARDIYGSRPLHWAAYHAPISVVKELIEERNAEINARNDGGRTALWFARQYHKPEVASYLVSHGGIE